jgi:hypothetical protein
MAQKNFFRESLTKGRRQGRDRCRPTWVDYLFTPLVTYYEDDMPCFFPSEIYFLGKKTATDHREFIYFLMQPSRFCVLAVAN